jgi:5-methylcytosine-specific restriction endonuclease McrA
MKTYLFVTTSESKPERIKAGRNPSWSCLKETRAGGIALVYVTTQGIAYQWRIESDARPDPEWGYVCDVSLANRIEPPIAFSELRKAFKPGQWKLLDQKFRNVRTAKITPGLKRIIDKLRGSTPKRLEDTEKEFAKAVSKSLKLSDSQRQLRLKTAKKKPEMREVKTKVYVRNADVVAEVLHRAKGQCESCSTPAPFKRRSDKTPYLEVHHIKRLVDGGDDTVKNAIALCPNCHRKSHFG